MQNTQYNKNSTPNPCAPLFPVPSGEPLVNVAQNTATRNEILQLVLQWLSAQGYVSAAQSLREEATSLLKNEASVRSLVRVLIRSIEERNWDNASRAVQGMCPFLYPEKISNAMAPSLRSPILQLVNTLPFLIAQQQFLELIGADDDGHKAYSFFMKHIKPLEPTVERNHFTKLNYLLTCKSVAEASHLYPEYTRWSPPIGCAQLLSFISRVTSSTSFSSMGSTTFVELSSFTHELKPLETYIEQALSFQLLASRNPAAVALNDPPINLSSLSAPFMQQLPPVQPIATVDIAAVFSRINSRRRSNITLTCSMHIPSANAIAVGLSTGDVLSLSTDFLKQEIKQLVIPEKYFKVWKLDGPVRGIRSSVKQDTILFWGDHTACLIKPSSFGYISSQQDTSECTLQTLDFDRPITCACVLPPEKVVGTGYSNGGVALWDVPTGGRIYKITLGSGSSIVALVSNRLGTVLYAGLQEGVVDAVDSVTGIYLHSFVPSIPMEISALALSPSSSFLLTAYRGGTLRLWDAVSGEEVLPHFVNTESTTRRASVTFGSTDYHIFCGQDDGSVLFWDTTISPRIAEIQQDQAQLSIRGQYLAPNLYYPTLRLGLHQSSVNDVSAAGDNFLLSCGGDGLLCICSSLPLHV